MAAEQRPDTQYPWQSASLVHALDWHVPWAQVKFAVHPLVPEHVAATQRCVASHVWLGPQSGSLAQPLVQCFCGFAPPL
jgi:hypothetical protein